MREEPMSPTGAKQQYLATAREALSKATIDDFLSFISVRGIVGGTATAAFYRAFPGGRDELLAELKRDAAPDEVGFATPVTVETVSRAMQLAANLKDGDRMALEELRDVALANFDRHFDRDTESNDILRNLMAAAALSDDEARNRLGDFYGALAREYAGLFGALLSALGREPIAAIDSMVDLVEVFSALYDGLATRARLGQPGKKVLAVTLLPIVAALTVSSGSEEDDPLSVLLA